MHTRISTGRHIHAPGRQLLVTLPLPHCAHPPILPEDLLPGGAAPSLLLSAVATA